MRKTLQSFKRMKWLITLRIGAWTDSRRRERDSNSVTTVASFDLRHKITSPVFALSNETRQAFGGGAGGSTAEANV